MAKMLSRVAPWLPSRRELLPRAIRVLTDADTPALQELVLRDPVANVFMATQLEASGSAVPTLQGAVVLGYLADDGGLLTACWVGSNVVPIGITAEQAPAFGQWLSASQRSFASVFGPAEAVLGIYAVLQEGGKEAADIRPNQPLLKLDGEPLIEGNPALRPSRPEDFASILPAAAAMFEEEVGYSPFLGGEEHYRRRVKALIAQGHSFSHLDDAGEVIFKADLGAVAGGVSQVQGVWVNPRYRGLGLSAGYMASVVRLAQRHATVTSLYVNDYNTRARAAYERVGFRPAGTFATVLF